MATELGTECTICLSSSIDNPAAIDSCAHRFCFACIKHWSDVTNQCPVCKADFRRINADDGQRVSVRKRVQKVAYEDTGLALANGHVDEDNRAGNGSNSITRMHRQLHNLAQRDPRHLFSLTSSDDDDDEEYFDSEDNSDEEEDDEGDFDVWDDELFEVDAQAAGANAYRRRSLRNRMIESAFGVPQEELQRTTRAAGNQNNLDDSLGSFIASDDDFPEWVIGRSCKELMGLNPSSRSRSAVGGRVNVATTSSSASSSSSATSALASSSRPSGRPPRRARAVAAASNSRITRGTRAHAAATGNGRNGASSSIGRNSSLLSSSNATSAVGRQTFTLPSSVSSTSTITRNRTATSASNSNNNSALSHAPISVRNADNGLRLEDETNHNESNDYRPSKRSRSAMSATIEVQDTTDNSDDCSQAIQPLPRPLLAKRPSATERAPAKTSSSPAVSVAWDEPSSLLVLSDESSDEVKPRSQKPSSVTSTETQSKTWRKLLDDDCSSDDGFEQLRAHSETAAVTTYGPRKRARGHSVVPPPYIATTSTASRNSSSSSISINNSWDTGASGGSINNSQTESTLAERISVPLLARLQRRAGSIKITTPTTAPPVNALSNSTSHHTGGIDRGKDLKMGTNCVSAGDSPSISDPAIRAPSINKASSSQSHQRAPLRDIRNLLGAQTVTIKSTTTNTRCGVENLKIAAPSSQLGVKSKPKSTDANQVIIILSP